MVHTSLVELTTLGLNRFGERLVQDGAFIGKKEKERKMCEQRWILFAGRQFLCQREGDDVHDNSVMSWA